MEREDFRVQARIGNGPSRLRYLLAAALIWGAVIYGLFDTPKPLTPSTSGVFVAELDLTRLCEK